VRDPCLRSRTSVQSAGVLHAGAAFERTDRDIVLMSDLH
jgi:hypothetical protein